MTVAELREELKAFSDATEVWISTPSDASEAHGVREGGKIGGNICCVIDYESEVEIRARMEELEAELEAGVEAAKPNPGTFHCEPCGLRYWNSLSSACPMCGRTAEELRG